MTEAWRRHRFGLLLIAVLVGVVFAPALIERQVFTFRDHADYFQPLRYYTAIHIRSFLLPYWNPFSASGEPWLANPQTGVFYPPTWLFMVLPFDTAYMLYLALHLILLGCGAYVLFARWVSPGAALVGSAIVTFCGPTMSLVDVSNNLASFAWVPLVIWCAVSRASWRTAAIVLAMTFLAGEPFFAALAAMMYMVVVRDVRKIVFAGAAAFGLSAIQLIPFLEMLRGSDRAARLSRDQIFVESMRVSDWLRIIVPPRYSWGAIDPNLSQHFIAVVYMGIPAVVLAVWAFAPRRGEKVRGARMRGSWVALLLFAIIVAAGNTLPLTGEIFARLPLTLFRYPSRVVPFGALAIAALASFGWDRLRPDRRWIDLMLVLIVVVELLPRERPLFNLAPFSTQLVPYDERVGRVAKIIRVAEKRVTNRSAWIAGYLNLYHRRYDAETAAPVVSERYLRLHDAAIAQNRRDLLNLTGAGFVLTDTALSGLQLIASHGSVNLYFNRLALPMATFWSRAESFARADDALRSVIERPVPGTLAITPRVEPAFSAAPAIVLPANFVSLDARHARAVVDAPSDGFVMLTQQDSPAWRVFVDGTERDKLVAFGVFRAVSVGKGRHEIEWRYRSRSFATGFAMTIITAAFLLLVKFVKRHR